MVLYCEKGQKPTITYKFANGLERKHISKHSPINVSTKRETEPLYGGQCPIYYWIKAESIVKYRDYRRGSGTNLETDFGPPTTVYFQYDTRRPNSDGQIRKILGPIKGIHPDYLPNGRYGKFFGGGFNGYAFLIDAAGVQPGSITITGWTPYAWTPSNLRGQDFNTAGNNCEYIAITEVGLWDTTQQDNCGDFNGVCALVVENENGVPVFIDKGECPCEFDVQCSECPEGTVKCDSSSYPGYCCLPCDEIKSEIRSITNIVRSINNG